MNNVKQCRQCGRLFESFGAHLCPRCVDEMEQNFIIVKDYVYDHPDANVFDVTKETGVPEKTVLEFLREGRLSMQASELECEECGTPISSGRLCSECKNKLENVLMSAYKPAKKEDKSPGTARMHIDYKRH
jgi:flagellar operon protein (TIGR03826 family)